MVEQLGPKTRADWVDQELRAAILSGELRPGEKLQTRALGRRWSVSPTPVREAIQRLAAEGLLEITPQRGARVAPISLTEAHEVHELRVALEPLALRSAMQTGNDTWRADLDAAYATLSEELRRGAPDRGAIEEAHRNYHLTLLSACSSAWMIRLIDLLNSHIIRYWTLTAAPRRDTGQVLDEHRRLHDLVTAGKTEVAVAELTAHLQHALHSVTERMREDSVD
jgi:DNA-binding GntR family transcriptional regulator